MTFGQCGLKFFCKTNCLITLLHFFCRECQTLSPDVQIISKLIIWKKSRHFSRVINGRIDNRTKGPTYTFSVSSRHIDYNGISMTWRLIKRLSSAKSYVSTVKRYNDSNLLFSHINKHYSSSCVIPHLTMREYPSLNLFLRCCGDPKHLKLPLVMMASLVHRASHSSMLQKQSHY